MMHRRLSCSEPFLPTSQLSALLDFDSLEPSPRVCSEGRRTSATPRRRSSAAAIGDSIQDPRNADNRFSSVSPTAFFPNSDSQQPPAECLCGTGKRKSFLRSPTVGDDSLIRTQRWTGIRSTGRRDRKSFVPDFCSSAVSPFHCLPAFPRRRRKRKRKRKKREKRKRSVPAAELPGASRTPGSDSVSVDLWMIRETASRP